MFFPIFCSISWLYIKFQTFFKKKVIVIANIFPKIQTVKDLVRPLYNKRHFRTRFDSQRVQGLETLMKSVNG